MYEINKLELSSLDNTNTKELSFSYMNDVFEKMSEFVPKNQLKEFYYNMFIIDALIGNTDRHNGNWAILQSENGIRISPVYDCGSSLAPLVDEKLMSQHDGEKCAMDAFSVLKSTNKRRLKYCEFFSDERNLTTDIKDALKRMMPRINLKKIDDIIFSTPYISHDRKNFYFGFIHASYEKILLPALEKSLNTPKKIKEYTSKECYDFYKKTIEPIKKTATYEKQQIGDTTFSFSKAGNIYESDKPISVISCRSNNRETRLNIQKFLDLNIPQEITLPKHHIHKSLNEYDDFDR